MTSLDELGSGPDVKGSAAGTVHTKKEEPTPKQRLLKRILVLRDSIEADKGVLSESYPLIREDRER
jgi:hypothetical protein